MITNHFSTRVKNRTGLSKNDSTKLFNNALKVGLYLDEFKCRPSFYNYLTSILRNNCECIIYNRYIIICSPDMQKAITILNLPKQYNSTVQSVLKNKKKEC